MYSLKVINAPTFSVHIVSQSKHHSDKKYSQRLFKGPIERHWYALENGDPSLLQVLPFFDIFFRFDLMAPPKRHIER